MHHLIGYTLAYADHEARRQPYRPEHLALAQ